MPVKIVDMPVVEAENKLEEVKTMNEKAILEATPAVEIKA